MEKVNARRGFLKGFGLLSVVAAGASAPVLANTSASSSVRIPDTPVLVPPVDQVLAPLGKTNLQLTADNRPPPPPPPGGYYGHYTLNGMNTVVMAVNCDGGMASTPEHYNTTKMSVGRDNRLWIEVDGKWRRVALEG